MCKDLSSLSELLGIELFEMHEAMDELGWTYTKVHEEEKTVDVRCCDAPVMLRGIAGVDTAQCVRCPKTMQNMAGLVPLKKGLAGFIEPELYENDGKVWLPVYGNDDDDLDNQKRVAALDIWSLKPVL